DGVDYFALGGDGAAGDAGAGGGGMASAAKLRRDVVHIHLLALGAKADAGQVGFDLFEHARYHHGLDGADVIDEAFGIIRAGAGAGEISFFQPEIGDAVVVGEAEMVEDVPQQAHARKRIGLINLIADPGQIGAAIHEFAGD